MGTKEKILLDTNFLLVPAQFKVDIFSKLKGYSLITTDKCIRELEKIGKGKGRDAGAARIASHLIRGKVKIVRQKGRNADCAILNYARKWKCIVATNDKKLIKNLKINKIRIIRLRQKKFLTKV